ncbi:MAG: DUF4404 family protein [Gemmataceae bacterium]
MPEPPSNTPEQPPLEHNLHELAQNLRQAAHLDDDTRQALARLMDELGHAVRQADIPSEEIAHLTESATQVARAVHEQHEAGMLAAARDRLEQAMLRAENAAPVASGIARRLIDALANLGI